MCAETVGRPQVSLDELVSSAERRLVRRRLAVVAASAAAAVLVAAGGFALRPDDERLAPAPSPPTKTEHPAGPLSQLVFGDNERSHQRQYFVSGDAARPAVALEEPRMSIRSKKEKAEKPAPARPRARRPRV